MAFASTTPRNSRGAARWAVLASMAQVVVLGGLWWAWSTGDSDSTSTSVDWAFIGLSAGTPAVLALSAASGRLVRKHHEAPPRLARAASSAVQWVTVGLFAMALALAPLVILGAVVFGPMG